MSGLTCPHISVHTLYIQIPKLHSWENGIHLTSWRRASIPLHSLMVIIFFKLHFLYIYVLCLSRVDVPMGGVTQVYTSLDEMEEKEEFKFSYANVRKATYTGIDCKFLIFQLIRLSILLKFSNTVFLEEYSYFGSLTQCSFQCSSRKSLKKVSILFKIWLIEICPLVNILHTLNLAFFSL